MKRPDIKGANFFGAPDLTTTLVRVSDLSCIGLSKYLAWSIDCKLIKGPIEVKHFNYASSYIRHGHFQVNAEKFVQSIEYFLDNKNNPNSTLNYFDDFKVHHWKHSDKLMASMVNMYTHNLWKILYLAWKCNNAINHNNIKRQPELLHEALRLKANVSDNLFLSLLNELNMEAYFESILYSHLIACPDNNLILGEMEIAAIFTYFYLDNYNDIKQNVNVFNEVDVSADRSDFI